jgi:hypothetical protein
LLVGVQPHARVAILEFGVTSQTILNCWIVFNHYVSDSTKAHIH